MSDKIDLIYDLVKEIDRKQDAQNEKLAKLEVHVETNTHDLTEHKQGVITARKLIAQNDRKYEARFAEIEAPKNTAKTLAKWITGIAGFVGVVAGAVYAVMRIYKL